MCSGRRWLSIGVVRRRSSAETEEVVLGVFVLPFRWILSSLLTSVLYILVFGCSLGSHIREVDGIPYLGFILPCLVLMGPITAS
jgi:hypothetical protein